MEAALAQVEASDQSRSRYLKRFYHVRWNDPLLYDLVVNTDSFTADAAADLLCQALHDRIPVLTADTTP
jgi:cytidylate kinase